jgi:hypothetical protein
MPIPLKPCEGKLSEESHEAIQRNKSREQWASHRCETCGRNVGVELIMGKWVPERHWPSVAYASRTRKALAEPTRRVPALQPNQDA